MTYGDTNSRPIGINGALNRIVGGVDDGNEAVLIGYVSLSSIWTNDDAKGMTADRDCIRNRVVGRVDNRNSATGIIVDVESRQQQRNGQLRRFGVPMPSFDHAST